MNVQLIPVIELFRSSDKVDLPEKGPYWEYADEWGEYNRKSLIENGFSEISPYQKGSNLYEILKIRDKDLLLQIKCRTEGFSIDEVCPFDGGYILNVNGVDLLYPQCCGDLGDISSWIELSKGESRLFWGGHPSPIIKVEKDEIFFDLSVDEFDELFVPTPSVEKFQIGLSDLSLAVENLLPQLKEFAVEIERINLEEKLGFDSLSQILIGKKI